MNTANRTTVVELQADEQDLEGFGHITHLLKTRREFLREVHAVHIAPSDVVLIVGGQQRFDDLSRNHI